MLSASTGSWANSPTSYAYQWRDCDASGGSCREIHSAKGSRYKLQHSDVADTVDVVVTATNADGSASAPSKPSGTVVPLPPASMTLPQVTGTADRGDSLSASPGTWSNNPSSYAYQWRDCAASGGSCSAIHRGTGPSYKLHPSDVGGTVDVVVTATNAGGSGSATSATTGVVQAAASPAPVNTAVPSISGTAQVSATLTASKGSWSNSPTSYGYQWQDCSGGSCQNISGATSSSYAVLSSDVGDTVDVVVTATNAGGSGSATSATTGVVQAAASPAPVNTAVPSISGTAQVSATLTASKGSWSNSPTSYGYQWQDCSGGSCQNISGATSSAYTAASSDLGDTIDVVVTATNAGGSTPATSAATSAITSAASGLSCSINATTANYASQIAAATPGQVVCLASGDYSGFTGTNKSAPGITITSAPGAAVTFNSGMKLNLSNVQNFTLDGTAGGGTMSVGGELDMETTGDASQNKALNITIQNVAFRPNSPSVLFRGPLNSNVTFNRDTFVASNVPCSGGSPVGLGGTFYNESSGSTPSGLTIENSVFVAPMDLWNTDRAIQDTNPMVVENNVIAGFVDHTESAGCNHIDGLQWFSGFNGTGGSVTFTGNLCYDDYGCAMAFDGTESNTITDNVCFDTETACLSLYSDSPGSVVNHNVQETRGADPGFCNTMNVPTAPIQSCGYNQLLINSNKSGDRVPSGETFTNNIDPVAPNVESGSVTTNTNNLWPSASSPNIAGTPTYVGGSNPTTWAGFELTSGSTGHDGGSDGLDVGVRASAGGPPTGGGSAPVNTVAPALSGTATHGDMLTTTNGTWTITGNVPTATTYQWFDCPTSTFSVSACAAIQPLTAPSSANGSTYTLQASDEGDYVFAMVTQTNANGQVNAHSQAVGPVN